MLLIQYQETQSGPSYYFRLAITSAVDGERLLKDGPEHFHIIVQSSPESMIDNIGRFITYEKIVASGARLASKFPDSPSQWSTSQNVLASWMVHFATLEAFSTPTNVIPVRCSILFPLPVDQNAYDARVEQAAQSSVWTVTLVGGSMESNSTLEVFARFDVVFDIKEAAGASFSIMDDDATDDIERSTLVFMTIELPSSPVSLGGDSTTNDDPIVVLPKRIRKKRALVIQPKNPPVFREPQLSQKMFDESLVFLPTKR